MCGEKEKSEVYIPTTLSHARQIRAHSTYVLLHVSSTCYVNIHTLNCSAISSYLSIFSLKAFFLSFATLVSYFSIFSESVFCFLVPVLCLRNFHLRTICVCERPGMKTRLKSKSNSSISSEAHCFFTCSNKETSSSKPPQVRFSTMKSPFSPAAKTFFQWV